VPVGRARPLKVRSVELTVTEAQATQLRTDPTSGLYFDWSPETERYHGHIDNAKLPEAPPMIFFPTSLSEPPPRAGPEMDPVAKVLDK
jgi:hypothetical protein